MPEQTRIYNSRLISIKDSLLKGTKIRVESSRNGDRWENM